MNDDASKSDKSRREELAGIIDDSIKGVGPGFYSTLVFKPDDWREIASALRSAALPVTLAADLNRIGDWLEEVYGGMPKYQPPGPPTSVVEKLRELALSLSSPEPFAAPQAVSQHQEPSGGSPAQSASAAPSNERRGMIPTVGALMTVDMIEEFRMRVGGFSALTDQDRFLLNIFCDEAVESLRAPSSELRFTPEQVKNLDEYQRAHVMHPFTCPNRGDGKHYENDGALVPTVRGWICPCCDYTQNWAHDFMLDGSAVKNDPIASALAESQNSITAGSCNQLGDIHESFSGNDG